ncbi:bifunctional DNA primase/polymerase [Streptoalloteichus tenebrarius]|uniref:bifunctional DNA primase/polymerase n=1 Tax=Streptoalloteichus tenebrarius (strain ATCC 17920 / DSM 40477 / JCM 4838 / CBS 697.72 / NBRC 16177 / NCIMB 11028 / NRRL B-12390 / A12253. 1 / ISP 5477) TaxID=1933 RepID=UPI003555DFCA
MARGEAPTGDGRVDRTVHPWARRADAAVDYARHGWKLLPGAIWDGRHYTRGHHTRVVSDLEPVLPVERATSDLYRVSRWWRTAPWSVLAVTGEKFDVITAPTTVAMAATHTMPWRHNPCPVAVSPSVVRFFVAPGAALRPDLATVPGVEVLPAGSLVPLPPTPVRCGVVTWWVSPSSLGWRLGSSLAVQAALVAVTQWPTTSPSRG